MSTKILKWILIILVIVLLSFTALNIYTAVQSNKQNKDKDSAKTSIESQSVARDSLDFFQTHTLQDGRQVLQLPTSSENTIWQTIQPQLKIKPDSDSSYSNFTNVIYNPSDKSFTSWKSGLHNLTEIKINGNLYWIFVSGQQLWLSRADFVDAQILFLPSGNQLNILELKTLSGLNSVVWIKASSYSEDNSTRFLQLLKIDLANVNLPVLPPLNSSFDQENDGEIRNPGEDIKIIQNHDLQPWQQEAIDLDKMVEQNVLTNSALIQTIDDTSGSDDIFSLEFNFDFFPLSTGQILLQSDYYTSNFWILEESKEYKLLSQIQTKYGFAVFSQCAKTKVQCAVYIPDLSLLWEIKLDENGNFNIIKIDAKKSSQLLAKENWQEYKEVFDTQPNRLLRINNDKAEFWRNGQWNAVM